ncbi:hypothetical protein FOL47_002285, partial [Perkinsus chesapeaki]
KETEIVPRDDWVITAINTSIPDLGWRLSTPNSPQHTGLRSTQVNTVAVISDRRHIRGPRTDEACVSSYFEVLSLHCTAQSEDVTVTLPSYTQQQAAVAVVCLEVFDAVQVTGSLNRSKSRENQNCIQVAWPAQKNKSIKVQFGVYCGSLGSESQPMKYNQSSETAFNVSSDEAHVYHAYVKDIKHICAGVVAVGDDDLAIIYPVVDNLTLHFGNWITLTPCSCP